MTLVEIQRAISSRIDMSGAFISQDSNAWAQRLVLINQAEDTFKRFLNGQWGFLLTNTTLTATPSQAYVELPADFEGGSMIAGNNSLITINEVNYTFRNYVDTLNYDTTDQFVWIEGNKATGFRLYIQPTPAAAYSIPFSYYSNQLATSTLEVGKEYLEVNTDITKIPDPYYLVDWVISELFIIDDEVGSKWQFYKESAQNRLLSMAVHDGQNQNQEHTMKIAIDEEGFDTFNSYGNED